LPAGPTVGMMTVQCLGVTLRLDAGVASSYCNQNQMLMIVRQYRNVNRYINHTSVLS
jgi:hypothetical protein